MSLTVDEVKQLVGTWYAKMLDWSKNNGVIKAKPNRKLSDQAHNHIKKALKSVGGHVAGRGGRYWFEVAEPPNVTVGFKIFEGD